MTAPLALIVGTSTELVSDGSILFAVPIAVAAGVVSFLSPCVLPLVPGYLAYVTGMPANELTLAPTGRPVTSTTRQTAIGAMGFVLGISVVFVSFGAVFGAFGRVLRENEDVLARVFGVLTIVLGMMLAGAFGRIAFFNKEARFHQLPRAGWVGAPVLGITFALGWTPCIGPTLGAVLGLAASSNQASATRGAVLSLAYCIGLGVPFLITGLAFGRAMRALSVVKRHYGVVMTFGGVMLIVIGTLQVTGIWTDLMDRLQSKFGGVNLPL